MIFGDLLKSTATLPEGLGPFDFCQYVRFLYTIGEPSVHAWDLPQRPDPGCLDLDRYAELLLRAAYTVFQPLGVKEETLRRWLFSNAGYGALPGELSEGHNGLPLFTEQGNSRARISTLR
jgi:hypothetical protein